jgi:hypothetical protein
MSRGAVNYLLTISLVATSFFSSQEPPLDKRFGAPVHLADATPPSPLPTRSEGPVMTGGSGARHFLLRETEGRSALERAKVVGRAFQLPRKNLLPGTQDLATVQWAHTCSVSLAEHHVRLQV